jgi:hypothetical protein
MKRRTEASEAELRKAEIDRLREEGIRRLRQMELTQMQQVQQQQARTDMSSANSTAASGGVHISSTNQPAIVSSSSASLVNGSSSTPLILKWKSKEQSYSREDLLELFSPFGEIDMVQIIKSGRAFVFFKQSQSAVSILFLIVYVGFLRLNIDVLLVTGGRVYRIWLYNPALLNSRISGCHSRVLCVRKLMNDR